MSQIICAVATPPVPCAIGILRISGEGTVALVDRLFRPKKGDALSRCPAGKMTLGFLYDREGRLLDEIQAVRYTGGYTGEESAELFCHGSPVVLALAMDALCELGARPAEPGAFTRRAFLNGKLDLTAAEGVMDLIDAQTPDAVYNAAGQVTGVLSQGVETIAGELADLAAHFCAVLDYPDEDLDPFTVEGMAETLRREEKSLSALLATYRRGRAITRGIPCAIVGKPNAGKSSLLNALLGYERAIVTDVPGTTRDTVEETATLGGVLLRLIDTAGLRQTADPVERLGVERSRTALEQSELALVVWDGTAAATEEDTNLLALARSRGHTVLVLSKSDLTPAEQPHLPDDLPVVRVSVRSGQGLAELERAVSTFFPRGEAVLGSLLTNQRQADSVRRAQKGVSRALAALEAGLTPDAALSDVETALDALYELTGRRVTDEVTDRIFSRFCVGK